MQNAAPSGCNLLRFPARLNILVGLLRLKSLTFFQRLSLLRVGAALLFAHPDTDNGCNR